jgi:hypothetical protein
MESLELSREDRRRFASWLGKQSYRARLERLGLSEIQRIARENGKKGGRPLMKKKEGT